MLTTTTIDDINDFCVIGDLIGTGSFSSVYKVHDIQRNIVAALKLTTTKENAKEFEILLKINHENIIQLIHIYETPTQFCLLFEYCERELKDVLEQRKKLIESEIRIITEYLVSAVNYLHSNLIVHRDIKVDNILLGVNPRKPDDQWFVKLIDFGFSSRRPKPSGNDFEIGNVMFTDICGTPQYMAPEIITKSYSQKCDVWSIGITIYELYTGTFPVVFSETDFDIAAFLIRMKLVYDNQLIKYDKLECSNLGKEFIKKCLVTNPAMRISVIEMMNDPWLSKSNENTNKNILLLMNEFYKRKSNEIKNVLPELELDNENSEASQSTETRTKA